MQPIQLSFRQSRSQLRSAACPCTSPSALTALVITGASSGICQGGHAAGAGDPQRGELGDLMAELTRGRAQAVAVVADVSREEDVRQIAQDAFGGFDT